MSIAFAKSIPLVEFDAQALIAEQDGVVDDAVAVVVDPVARRVERAAR